MNIDTSTSNINLKNETNSVNSGKQQNDSSVKFADELEDLKSSNEEKNLNTADKQKDLKSVKEEKNLNPADKVTNEQKNEEKTVLELQSQAVDNDNADITKTNILKNLNIVTYTENNKPAANNKIIENSSGNENLSENKTDGIKLFEMENPQGSGFMFNQNNNDDGGKEHSIHLNSDNENEANILFKNSQEAVNELNLVLNELNQSDEKQDNLLKTKYNNDDNKIKNKFEGAELINNDFSIQDTQDKLPQMNPNMNFSGDGQPFSSFMNNEEQSKNTGRLTHNAKDLEEEAAIMSTMAENVAMANKMNIKETGEVTQKIVNKNDGIKKVDTKTGITQEVIVKYDTVIMNEADVEVFTKLVNGGEVNLNNLTPESAQKSVHVSKTLADMLSKAMEDNKPIRIEFDNGISVIIKISRDGKLSADFLPSTQVAEAYLKENLPLLKQRFDEQNIDYDELNRRERREQQREQDRKKGRDNE